MAELPTTVSFVLGLVVPMPTVPWRDEDNQPQMNTDERRSARQVLFLSAFICVHLRPKCSYSPDLWSQSQRGRRCNSSLRCTE